MSLNTKVGQNDGILEATKTILVILFSMCPIRFSIWNPHFFNAFLIPFKRYLQLLWSLLESFSICLPENLNLND